MVSIIDFLTLKNALRLLLLVFMFGYCIYAFFLMMRVKILAQTLKTEKSATIATFAWLHFIMVIVGCLITAILIFI